MTSLRSDTLANLAAFGVMAISGVALNVLVVALAGEAALGVFNQVYAAYVIASMLAVFSVHDSVHREVAAHQGDPDRQRRSLSAGLAAVVTPAGFVAGWLYVLARPLGAWVDSPDVGEGLAFAAPALFVFAVNKVLMSALAGAGRLQAFAAVQIVRILTLVSVVVGLAASGAPPGLLPAGFAAAELVILPILLVRLRPSLSPGIRDDVRAHLSFGARALPNGLIGESFLRVDVLMLAPFVDDAAIGVYSLAAMFGEGLVQIGGVVRSVMGPRLVPVLMTDEAAPRRWLLRQAMGMGFGAFLVVATGLAVGFPVFEGVVDPDVVASAHAVLGVLLIGLGVNAAFLPLDQLLLWAGRPGHQSVMMMVNLGINVALNLALIPRLGITGAALATALAWASSAVVLHVAVHASLGLRGGPLGEALRRTP